MAYCCNDAYMIPRDLMSIVIDYLYPPWECVNVLNELHREMRNWRANYYFGEENYFALYFFWSKEDYDYDPADIFRDIDA